MEKFPLSSQHQRSKMESKKLLHKLFLRNNRSHGGSNNNTSASQSSEISVSCIGFHKLNHSPAIKQISKEEEEENRYKRRQRKPDDDNNNDLPALPKSASPNNNVVDLFKKNNSEEEDKNKSFSEDNNSNVDKKNQRSENELLKLSWTCETLDKRKDQITDYFQRSVLKQKVDSTNNMDCKKFNGHQNMEDEEPQYPKIIEIPQKKSNGSIQLPDIINVNNGGDNNNNNYYKDTFACNLSLAASYPLSMDTESEPIYAEIDTDSSDESSSSSASSFCSVRHICDYDSSDSVQKKNSSSANSTDGNSSGTDEGVFVEEEEHLYENLDIMKQELELKNKKVGDEDKNVKIQESLPNPAQVDLESAVIETEVQKSSVNHPTSANPKEPKKDEFIDEESIIENKPAIKNYWENKMRESSQSSAASQFARSNFGVASPQTIIDKMNEEIREDYLRNLELLHDEGLPNSSASETSEPIEFDSFDMASNGSSPYGQLMAESPTLIDSGHQSQESHLPPDPDHDDDDDIDEIDAVDAMNRNRDDNETSFDGSFSSPTPAASLTMTATSTQNNTNNPNQTLKRTISNPFGTDYMGLPKLGSQPPQPQQQQQQQPAKFIGNSRVVPNVSGYRPSGKIENHVTHYIAFNKPFSVKVKPFEESTEEKEVEQSSPKQPKEILEEKFTSQEQSQSQSQLPAKSVKSDISYLLATSRLKKEIEDNLKRERELKEQGRVKTLSVETVSLSSSSSTLAPSQVQEITESKPQQQPAKTTTQKSVQLEAEKRPSEEPEKLTAIATTHNQKEEPQLEKKITQVEKSGSTKHNDDDVNNDDVSSNVVNNNSNTNSNSSTHPVDNAKLKLQQQSFNSFKIGKNFNSLERYIMYSSMTKLNLRSMPPVWSNKSADNSNNNNTNGGISPINNNNANFEFDNTPQKTPQNPLAVTAEGKQDEAEPVEKIRKNYVPTEKRIKDELLEMVQREEELKKTRQSQWKSTPNLSNLNLDDEEEEHQKTQEDAPVTLRRPQHQQEQSPRVATEKRRRSALISKWEEMISQNNPN